MSNLGPSAGGVRIGVDVGGTFTDVVLTHPDGRMFINKTTTTPQDPGEGVVAGIVAVLADAGMAGRDVAEIVHGTTVASNTILQRVGARTGLLTTRGFRDVLEIGRIRTPGMFDMRWRKPDPLVPRRWRLEAIERIAADGSIVTPLDERSVRDAASRFRDEGIEAVAICFINSYINAAHEHRAAEILAETFPELLITASCDVLPEMKEYERTSTAVVNAYLLPAMRGYLIRLQQRLVALSIAAPLQVMASNGGMIGVESASAKPVFAVASGPAGGVTGAARLGALLGETNLIVFDMGGTTAKASIIEKGIPSLVTEYEFRDGISMPSRFTKGAGYMLKVPAIDIAEVGSGGGSVASLDAGGLLRVGPESVGGDPGPACYGRGNTRPSVTDADMVLGYLNPRALAGGTLPVSRDLAEASLREHLCPRLGIDAVTAAHGVREVANVSMARAIRAVTVERGKDPRRMSLMAFGGGGPLHAADVATLLGIRLVIIAPVSGVFSAAGMLTADVEHSFVRPVFRPLDGVDIATVQATIAELMTEGRAALDAEGYAADQIELRIAADLRYFGQSSDLTVRFGVGNFDDNTRSNAAAEFHALYADTFGYSNDEPVELVNVRLTARGLAPGRLDFARFDLDAQATAGTSGERSVSFKRGEPSVAVPVIARSAVAEIPMIGPLIVESYDTTIVVPPLFTIRMGIAGCLVMELPE